MDHSSNLAETVGGVVGLLLIAAGVFAFTRRVKLPFTVVLVITGMALASLGEAVPPLSGFIEQLQISPALILYVFLPTLVFESAFNLDARLLRQSLWPVVLLAVPGLLLSTLVIGAVIVLATPIGWVPALLLGAILSATDPVAVVALFKKLGAPQRLNILVEGESLFNDATSIVLARILIAVLVGGAVTAGTVLGGAVDFTRVFLGGLVVGWFLGLATVWLLGRCGQTPFVDITLTTVVAYLSFLVAEELLHVSGVMAIISAGILLGGWGRLRVAPAVRAYLDHFWEYLGFIANALIFLMVGLRVELPLLFNNAGLLGVVIVAMILSRAVVVFGLMPLVGKMPGQESVSQPFQAVMFWGGLRGAIALAIVLSLPPFPLRDTFVALVMGSVLFTLLVQGLTMERLVRRLGLDRPPLSDRFARLESDLAARQKALDRLPELLAGGLFSGAIGERLRTQCEAELHALKDELKGFRDHELDPSRERQLLVLRCLVEEKSACLELFNQGQLSEAAFRRLNHSLAGQIDSARHRDTLHRTEEQPVEQRLIRVTLRVLGSVPFLGAFCEKLRLHSLATDYELAWGRFQASQHVLNLLDEFQRLKSVGSPLIAEVRGRYQQWHGTARRRLDQMAEQFPEFVSEVQERLGRRLVLLSEFSVVEERAEHGILPRATADVVEETLQAELQRLRGRGMGRLHVEPSELLRKVPFFADIPREQFDLMAQGLRARTVAEDEFIIQQGGLDDSLFLIARGVVRVSRGQDGVQHDLATLVAGDFFGEMALLRHEPRKASVRAVTPCSLYEITRETVERIAEEHPGIRAALETASQKRLAEVARTGVSPQLLLRKVPFLRDLSAAEFDLLTGHLQERSVSETEEIVRQGEAGDSLFLIARGTVRVSRESRGKSRELAVLVPGDFFGEMAILHREARSATVRAVTPSTLYELRRSDLEDLIAAHPGILDTLETTALRRAGQRLEAPAELANRN